MTQMTLVLVIGLAMALHRAAYYQLLSTISTFYVFALQNATRVHPCVRIYPPILHICMYPNRFQCLLPYIKRYSSSSASVPIHKSYEFGLINVWICSSVCSFTSYDINDRTCGHVVGSCIHFIHVLAR
eukprot:32502_1